MEIDPQLLRQLVETFRIQLEERLEVLSEGLIRLEQGIDRDDRTHVLDAMFRAAHNIKGAARGIGLEHTADIAHRMESLFSTLRGSEEPPHQEIIDLNLAAIDLLRSLVDLEGDGRDPGPAVSEMKFQLDAALEGEHPVTSPGPKPVKAKPATAGSVHSIRLPVERLDRIASHAEDLQVVKIRVDDHLVAGYRMRELCNMLQRLWARNQSMTTDTLDPQPLLDNRWLDEGADLVTEIQHLSLSFYKSILTTVTQLRPLAVGLSDDVRALRMVPADTVLRSMTRVVRDSARVSGKSVELNLIGGNTEMDRAVLDALRNPLTHLLRNAVDHGIENASEREAIGKSPCGTITVHLEQDGGIVRFTIKDDGAGINYELVRRRAAELGLVTDAEAAVLETEELADLLFRPGFSTRSVANSLSGRGVGLDVVKVNLQALNGHIQVFSNSGKGTTFILNVPVSMATDHGLLMLCAGHMVAVPSQYVHRILEITPEEVVELEATQAVLVDGEPVPLRSLSALLRLDPSQKVSSNFLEVVVINQGWSRVALLVDHVLGDREMIVKPLAPPLISVPNIAGGALGREGDIIMVLNVSDILENALTQKQQGRAITIEKEQVKQQSHANILVVDDSITTRNLEQGILETAGYQVRAVSSGEEALDQLNREDFDLMITDVEMPGIDGFELTRRVRNGKRHADLPVVIVTSLGSEEDRRRGVEVKADAYIVKSSFHSSELLEIVGQLL
jgi:two-component system, chemotaxis family, sensor kinase CheA